MKDLAIYGVLALFVIGAIWGGWALLVMSMPPIKVIIVN